MIKTLPRQLTGARWLVPGHGEPITEESMRELVLWNPNTLTPLEETVLARRTVFEAPLRMDLVHAAVVRERAAARQNPARVKNRAMVRGGGKKPWKQKGTGRARAGSIRSPLWRGGGKAHGPTDPRNFHLSAPKKVVRAALRAAISHKLFSNQLVVWPELLVDSGHRTRPFAQLIEQHGYDQGVLFVDAGDVSRETHELARAAANVPSAGVISIADLNMVDLLRFQQLVLSRSAVEILNDILAPKRPGFVQE